MRDALLIGFMAVALIVMVLRPTWGVLSWVWWGIMNPHRFTWGLATTIPFAWAIGIATVIGAVFSKEPKRLKGGLATAILLALVAYMAFTTLFALVPLKAWPMLERTAKIQIGTLLALVLLYRKEHVIALVWVVAASIGFYAVKGGLFTIFTLGQYRVWGPEDSFIYDNNAFALASVMSIPLWAFLFTLYKDRPWLRLLILGAMALSAVSAIGSHSRGAVVAILAMAVFLWLKSKRKLLTGSALLVASIGLVVFMPQQWDERIATIADPTSETSASSRIRTWTMLGNLALDRPLTGGGFETYERWVYERYSLGYPLTERVYSAHSIYFQVLGEHGFLALLLFLCFWAAVWRMCSQVAQKGLSRSEDEWAYWLAQMLKVSILAYLVGGAFLNLAYWDVPYYLFVAAAVARWVLARSPRIATDDSGDPRHRVLHAQRSDMNQTSPNLARAR